MAEWQEVKRVLLLLSELCALYYEIYLHCSTAIPKVTFKRDHRNCFKCVCYCMDKFMRMFTFNLPSLIIHIRFLIIPVYVTLCFLFLLNFSLHCTKKVSYLFYSLVKECFMDLLEMPRRVGLGSKPHNGQLKK